jgi:hypothetical protein
VLFGVRRLIRVICMICVFDVIRVFDAGHGRDLMPGSDRRA